MSHFRVNINLKGDEIIRIKIIGSNSSNGIKLKKMVKKAIKNSEINIDLYELNDNYKSRYNIKNTPALIINDEIVSTGKILSDREIKKLITLKAYN